MRKLGSNRSPFRKATPEMWAYAYLYHSTWKFNLDSIMKRGLLPKDNGATNFNCKRGVYLTHDAYIGIEMLETTENPNIDDPDNEPKVLLAISTDHIQGNKLFVDNCYHFDEDPDDNIICFRYDLVIPPQYIQVIADTSKMSCKEISELIGQHQSVLIE